MIIGSAMEALVTWTIVGLELAALAVIAGGFAWSAGKRLSFTSVTEWNSATLHFGGSWAAAR